MVEDATVVQDVDISRSEVDRGYIDEDINKHDGNDNCKARIPTKPAVLKTFNELLEM